MKQIMLSTTLLLFIFTATSFMSCKKNETAAVTQKIQPVNVTVQQMKPSQMIDGLQVSGTVKAFEDVMMSPEEGGIVKEWKKKRGDRVKKGDLIVVLKDEVVKASYEAADAQYKMAQLNVEKQQSVYEQQGISELQYKNMVYGRDAAKANADLMNARWERTKLRSPINGIVDNTVPNEGEMAPPGIPIARVVNLETIKIQAEIPEMYSGAIKVGTSASVMFDAVQGETLTGKVTFVGSTVSAANRTMAIEILLPNPHGKLKPEMVAKVNLIRQKKNDAILVSENIVQLVDRDRYIVYVEHNGVAEERRVKIGGRQGSFVEIVEGLRAGEMLIVSGYQKLVNGSPVVITQ
ncbi:MAG: efflux RND transporter periplasmic adaptor subunit [Bacteriovoracaceae bacterium]|nr:efflux RND transporter periplasmic adaptor subunit [Bacteroidota bacterium]